MKVNNKELILETLKNSIKPISGEELSKELNISRTGVWKHIKSLISSGYRIESSHDGYLLIKENDLLLPYEFTKDPSLIIHNLNTTSTMDTAYDLIQKGKIRDGTIVLAESQSSGMGRKNTKFSSPKGGLYFTLISLTKSSAHYINIYPMAMLISIHRALNNILDLHTTVKWPMELWNDKEKISGVIHEYQIRRETVEWVSIGAGINMNIEPHRKEVLDAIRESYLELIKDLESVFLEYKELTGIINMDILGTVNNRQGYSYIGDSVKKDN